MSDSVDILSNVCMTNFLLLFRLDIIDFNFSFVSKGCTQSLNSNNSRLYCFSQIQWPSENSVVRAHDIRGLTEYSSDCQVSVPSSNHIGHSFIFKLFLKYALKKKAHLRFLKLFENRKSDWSRQKISTW